MPLSAGDRIGHYEILPLLGKGGMGEVYRARDSKLKRDVAIKVLPEAFASDAERMARFQREAEVLASLNHPNIAHIYGVEDRALVMELVEGNPPKGPLPFDEAWKIASQIAAALEYAHERGIIHRDLKPANIMITPDGVVKLLDFGLAKAFSNEKEPSASPENSTTLTLGATDVGVILGTAAYMAPEQARGKAVDKRADIWSFGVVLYGLLTGKRLFQGEDLTETLASVVKENPDLSGVSPQVQRLLKSCLEKDPKKRLRDIGDAWRLLELHEPTPVPRGRRWIWAALGTALIVTAIAVGAFFRPPPVAGSYRLSIAAPPGLRFAFGPNVGGSAISPDGSMLAFVADDALWVRSLDSDSAQKLPGTEHAYNPFWSPDQRSIGFFAVRKLKRVNLPSGPVLELAQLDRNSRGGAWNKQGTILFSQNGHPLYRIPSTGGTPVPVASTTNDDVHFSPAFLPDGERFLYLNRSRNPSTNGVFAGSLTDPKLHVRVLDTFSNAIYIPSLSGSGYLFYARQSALLAQPFDPKTLETTREPITVAPFVGFQNPLGLANFSVSQTGTVVIGKAGEPMVQMTWFDRSGKLLSTPGPTDFFSAHSRLSPDGSRIALAKRLPTGFDSLWLYDFVRGTMSHLDDDGSHPAWSADGRTLLYDHQQDRTFVKRLPDSPALEVVAKINEIPGNAIDWSPDGKYVAIPDMVLLPLFDPAPKDHPIRVGSGFFPRFSPDGNWLAYASNESRAGFDIVVQHVPDGRTRTTVSTNGGFMPRWRSDGKELFYTNSKGEIMALDVKPAGANLSFGSPRLLFAITNQVTFEVSPDGQRILSLRAPQTGIADDQLTILLNWREKAQK